MPVLFRYFLALLPPAWLVPGIARQRALAGPLRTIVGDARLHLTLVVWPLRPRADARLVDRIDRLMTRFDPVACRVALRRRIVTRAGARLTPVGACDELRSLQARLQRAMADADPIRRAFSPHVTLGYDAAHETRATIDPLGWQAADLVLIESHHGLSHHRRVATWPLIDRQAAFDFRAGCGAGMAAGVSAAP